ncbi:hypothetical protein PPROV_000207600 [Pycnococcus provasolii]|uniref:Uncharacterized protein n=1 Tax=Pycnococcus provasolii TaxID=41880 RepID=A0A830HCL5_9CHLO|nr:hypothetical protein PPROV_000207600 [Pycnococcus provasolii]
MAISVDVVTAASLAQSNIKFNSFSAESNWFNSSRVISSPLLPHVSIVYVLEIHKSTHKNKRNQRKPSDTSTYSIRKRLIIPGVQHVEIELGKVHPLLATTTTTTTTTHYSSSTSTVSKSVVNLRSFANSFGCFAI